MSKQERIGPNGKDVVIFATKEDHAKPSTVNLPEPEPSPGLILPNGDINWNCPCLGGMATGPCGVQFREAFSCFHYSEADPKGSDCYDQFSTMQDCMAKYPELYNKDAASDDDDEGVAFNEAMQVDADTKESKELTTRSDPQAPGHSDTKTK